MYVFMVYKHVRACVRTCVCLTISNDMCIYYESYSRIREDWVSHLGFPEAAE